LSVLANNVVLNGASCMLREAAGWGGGRARWALLRLFNTHKYFQEIPGARAARRWSQCIVAKVAKCHIDARVAQIDLHAAKVVDVAKSHLIAAETTPPSPMLPSA
jgi:hypothetical protein